MAGAEDCSSCVDDEITSKISDNNEKHFLPILEDVAEWISKMFDQNVNVDNFLDILDDGYLLCQLAGKIQLTSEAFCMKNEKKLVDKNIQGPLPPFSKKIHKGAKKMSFQARDNAANFISWCKKIGINESMLFESDGLVLHRQLKNVTLTVFELGRIGEKYGLSPIPNLVKLEKEILEEETTETMACKVKDEVDKRVKKLAAENNVKLTKVKDGKYVLNDKITFHTRPLRRHVMVRVGGGWDEIEHFISRHGTEKLQKAFLSHPR